jgi:hypothetical protein
MLKSIETSKRKDVKRVEPQNPDRYKPADNAADPDHLLNKIRFTTTTKNSKLHGTLVKMHQKHILHIFNINFVLNR